MKTKIFFFLWLIICQLKKRKLLELLYFLKSYDDKCYWKCCISPINYSKATCFLNHYGQIDEVIYSIEWLPNRPPISDHAFTIHHILKLSSITLTNLAIVNMQNPLHLLHLFSASLKNDSIQPKSKDTSESVYLNDKSKSRAFKRQNY